MPPSDDDPAFDPSTPNLPTDLIAPEASPVGLKPDEKSKKEAWLWKYLPGWPSKERVELGGTIIDIILRTGMSAAFLALAWWWLAYVGSVIDKQCEADSSRHLSDAVLVALLTTTTINVLGLLYFVANYLFPKQAAVKDRLTPTQPGPPSLNSPQS